MSIFKELTYILFFFIVNYEIFGIFVVDINRIMIEVIEKLSENKRDSQKASLELAKFCGMQAFEKLASDIVIIDLRDIEFAVSDYFVICSCESDMQLSAVSSLIERSAKEQGYGRPRTEGLNAKEWALLDYFDVVVHVMMKIPRSYYQLEKLWIDGKFQKLNAKGEYKKFNTKKIGDFYIEIPEETEDYAALSPDFWDRD